MKPRVAFVDARSRRRRTGRHEIRLGGVRVLATIRASRDENVMRAFRCSLLLVLGFVAVVVGFAGDRGTWTIRPVPAADKDALVRVAPDRADWTYAVGETPRFTITVALSPYPAGGVTVSYKAGPEMWEGAERTITVPAGGVTVEGGTLPVPGFIRCIARATIGDKEHRGLATAGLSPERLAPTQQEPADFDAFWTEQKAVLAGVPIDARLTPAPELSDEKVEASYVSLQNISGTRGRSRVYGVLMMPRGAGPFPAVLNVPGAGVRPYRGNRTLAEQGVITLQIGIHGIPVNLPEQVYLDLAGGALSDYPRALLDVPDRYYYRRVYLGCLRANDFLVSLPQWDRKNLVVMGGSQGGQLSIVTAALDSRVTALAADYPAYCDVSGYLHGRAGGWPGLFRPGADGKRVELREDDSRRVTMALYDAVNFARRLKVPGHFWWGYNDETCPPTSMFSAYNVITSPNQLVIQPQQGHPSIPEQGRTVNTWVLGQVRKTTTAAR